MTTGEKIKSLRKSLGMTQQELAGEEFTKGYISQIEKGTVKPSMNVLTVIANRLSKPIAYFLEGQDEYTKKLEEVFTEAENLFYQSEYEKATDKFRSIVKNNPGSGLIYTNSLLYIGKCLIKTGEIDDAILELETAINYLEKQGLLDRLVDAYYQRGGCFFNKRLYDSAIKDYQQAIKLISNKSLQLSSLKARLQLNMATSYMNTGRLTMAIHLFEENINFCKKESVNDTLLDCYVRSSYIYFLLGEISRAKANIISANSINTNLNDELVWTEIYNILGLVIFKEGKVSEALRLLEKSKETCQKLSYKWGYYVNVVDSISILLDIGKIEEAEDMVDKHLCSIQELNDQKLISKMLILKGRLALSKGDNEEALAFYTSAISSFKDFDNKWEVYTYSNQLADWLIDIDPLEAKKYYKLSLDYLAQVTAVR